MLQRRRKRFHGFDPEGRAAVAHLTLVLTDNIYYRLNLSFHDKRLDSRWPLGLPLLVSDLWSRASPLRGWSSPCRNDDRRPPAHRAIIFVWCAPYSGGDIRKCLVQILIYLHKEWISYRHWPLGLIFVRLNPHSGNYSQAQVSNHSRAYSHHQRC